MNEATIKYKKEDFTVLWKPHVCTHSTNCWKGLPEVFDPKAKPWVNVTGAEAERIMEQIDKCPSGALSYTKNNSALPNTDKEKNVKIQITAGGPLLVEGVCIIVDKDGKEETKDGKFALCRCGQSRNKPFCDGSHRTVEFDK